MQNVSAGVHGAAIRIYSSPWLRWIFRRVLQAIPVIIGVAVLCFAFLRLVPGDPVAAILGIQSTPEAYVALRRELRLDGSVWHQFLEFFGGLLHGDLGNSIVQSGQSVLTLILPALGITLTLTGFAIVIALVIGLILGAWAGTSRSRTIDLLVRGSATLMLATPTFLVGFVLLFFVALKLGLAPVGGWASASAGDTLSHIWLPAISLSIYLIPIIARSVRQSILETMSEDYVESAVARGIAGRLLIVRHILPASLVPLITIVGFSVGGLVSGAVVIESVFSIPGTGTVLIQAVQNADYPIVQGIALEVAILVILVTAISDALRIMVDPRLSPGREA